jgi:UDP-glucuronate decarboxylase
MATEKSRRMKKILISGGSGFIGSHLCDHILQRSDVSLCVVIDNLWTGSHNNIAHLKDPRLHFVKSDVEDFRSDQKFNEIYHLASPASPFWYMAEPRRTISANLIGAMRLLELLAQGGRFAFTSTSEVYGETTVSPQPETCRGSVDCTGPRSSYDESKRCTESLLFETRRLKRIDLRVVRLFNVYGPRTQPNDGRAISNFIAQALAGRPITIFGDGMQSRSWGYIDDIVEALSRYFWRDQVDYVGPLNIGNDREIPVVNVAKYIAKLTGSTRIIHRKPVPQDPAYRCPDLTIARRVLPGWYCKVHYEQGVRLTIEWFEQQMRLRQPDLANRAVVPITLHNTV